MKTNTSIHYFLPRQKRASMHFVKLLKKEIKNALYHHCTIVFLCIGSDRATGDCFGPIIGTHISRYFSKKTAFATPVVFGTLNEPVHAANLEAVLNTIHNLIENPYIIAMDASLGIAEHIGQITLENRPLSPGTGVNKRLPETGNLSITGIVNKSGTDNHAILQSTNLSTVVELAHFVAGGIIKAYPHSHIHASF